MTSAARAGTPVATGAMAASARTNKTFFMVPSLAGRSIRVALSNTNVADATTSQEPGRRDRAEPERGGGGPAEDITGIMNSQIDARKADGRDQQRGRRPDPRTRMPAWRAGREHMCQHA